MYVAKSELSGPFYLCMYVLVLGRDDFRMSIHTVCTKFPLWPQITSVVCTYMDLYDMSRMAFSCIDIGTRF